MDLVELARGSELGVSRDRVFEETVATHGGGTVEQTMVLSGRIPHLVQHSPWEPRNGGGRHVRRPKFEFVNCVEVHVLTEHHCAVVVV